MTLTLYVLSREVGFAPATTFLRSSRKIASARTVAVIVPSPATLEILDATSRTSLSSHVFVRVLEFDFLRHGSAVFRDGWTTVFLVQDDVRPDGSEGAFTQ